MQEIRGWGVDRERTDRPGVPMEHAPEPVSGAHWNEPVRQPASVPITHRHDAPVSAVFGTAQPPRGLSGRMRRMAYRIPEWRARHWMLLLLADRVDIVEGLLEDLAKRAMPNRLGKRRAGRAPTLERPPSVREPHLERERRWDVVDEASWESFPASDAPASWAGRDLKGEA